MSQRVKTSASRLLAVGMGVLLVVWTVHFATHHVRQFGPIAGHTAPASEGPSSLVRSLRPSYPYSIIPGGAYSPGELQFAHSKDAVVRAHYSDFDVKHAQMVRLTDDRFQYVSYRIKDQVYWTKKKLRIPAGELLLTDGVQYARARCGNRLSGKPHKATSAREPDSALLTLPPVSIDLLPQLALVDTPRSGSVPSMAIPSQSRTEAVQPSGPASWPISDRPLVPLESVWGGQPVGGGFVPSGPVSNGLGSSLGGGSATPVIAVTNPAKTVPNPIDQSPVPEPSSVYFFLLTLLAAGWALLRISKRKKV